MAQPYLHPSPASRPAARVVLIAPAPIRGRLAAALAADGLWVAAAVERAEDVRIAPGSAEVAVLAADIRQIRAAAHLRRLRERCGIEGIVLVRSVADGHAVRRALEAGVDGMVAEEDVERALAATVRAVASGQVAVPATVRARLVPPALSHRERQVLALVVEGCTNGEIAQRLFLAESTVKSHLATAFAKLGVRSRRDAAAMISTVDALASVILGTRPEPSAPEPFGAPRALRPHVLRRP